MPSKTSRYAAGAVGVIGNFTAPDAVAQVLADHLPGRVGRRPGEQVDDPVAQPDAVGAQTAADEVAVRLRWTTRCAARIERLVGIL